MNRTRLFAPGAVALACGTALAQATFSGTGFIPGGVTYSEGQGLSADRQTAVGGALMTGGIGGRFGAFAWSAETGVVPLFPSQGPSSVAMAASADGNVIAGWADYGLFSPLGVQGFYWTQATGPMLIGDLPTNPGPGIRSYVRAISADGMTLAGDGTTPEGIMAFTYRRDTGQFRALGVLSETTFGSWAYDISPDGATVVGGSYVGPGQLKAFRWREATGLVGLAYLATSPGVTPWSEAEAVSADGAVVVGQCRSVASGNGLEACRWTDEGPVGLGDLPGGAFQSVAYGVSADGSVVVGRATVEGPPGPFGGGSLPRAFIWDAAHGMRDFQAVLAAAGAPVVGWALQEIRGVSADGTAFVGTGLNPMGQTEAWHATLPRPACAANCDGSTATPVLNVADYICFLNLYAAEDTRANCDASTATPTLNVADFICFTNAFAAGCP